MIGIPLRTEMNDGIAGFLRSYHSETRPNPFNATERVWEGKVRFCVEHFQDYIWIGSIEAITKNKGHGTEGVNWLLDLARDHSVTLKGNVLPFGQGFVGPGRKGQVMSTKQFILTAAVVYLITWFSIGLTFHLFEGAL